MKRYNPKNCLNKLRKSYIDILGREISITGKHAGKWTITVKDSINFFSISFPDRMSCLKEAKNKYKPAKE